MELKLEQQNEIRLDLYEDGLLITEIDRLGDKHTMHISPQYLKTFKDLINQLSLD
jgi:hypothetical protein